MISLQERKGTGQGKGCRCPKEAATRVLTKAPTVYHCDNRDRCSVRFAFLPEETRPDSGELRMHLLITPPYCMVLQDGLMLVAPVWIFVSNERQLLFHSVNRFIL